jgi:DNA-binding response OmpR family regulator
MSAVHTVLIVEDDWLLSEALADYISQGSRFDVREAGTLREAEVALNDKDRPVSVMIVDVNLPDGDGRDFCARLRRQGRKLSIIILSGANRLEDIVRGLDAGADDYIVKPFGAEELMARVRAQLRAFENSGDATIAIGCYTLHPSTMQLHEMGKERRVKLTQKEVAILKVLYRSDTRPVTRQVLMQEVWGYNPAVTTHTLETHIYRLRQKMELDPRNPVLLVTGPAGYVLNPTVGAAAVA